MNAEKYPTLWYMCDSTQRVFTSKDMDALPWFGAIEEGEGEEEGGSGVLCLPAADSHSTLLLA